MDIISFIFSKLAFPDDFTEFQTESLTEHNFYREKHESPALKLNKNLCDFALEWAEQLAEEDEIYHRPDNNYGENLYWAYNTEVTGKSVVKEWYDEIKDYNFKKEKFQPNCGHFTQLVWKNTKEFGIALKVIDDTIWIVANYDPPGNFKGQFKDNVLPLKEENVPY